MSIVFVHRLSLGKFEPVSLPTVETDTVTLKRLIFERCFVFQDDVSDSYYLCCNGRKLQDTDCVQNGHHIHVVSRLPGGKGGFGSMLRAIGAQIEKTTNREACRDLSGRRLRDINEEMRLKKWIAKQTEREQEREARKKEKLERRLATPKHEFRDPTYDKQRSSIPDRVNDALVQGLALAKSGEKRTGPEIKNAPKKMRLWLGADEEELEDESSGDDNEMAAGCSSWSTNKPKMPSISLTTDDSSSSSLPTIDTSIANDVNGGPSSLKDLPDNEAIKSIDTLKAVDPN